VPFHPVDDFANLWLEQLRMVEADDKFWDWAFKRDFIDRNEEYQGYALEASMLHAGIDEDRNATSRFNRSLGTETSIY
jgi:hypothetical protein